jgi:hypothetical protein
MHRPLAVLLVALGACSRGSPAGDVAPVAPATAAGIAPAASSARIDPTSDVPAPSGAFSAPGGLVVPPSPGSPSRPHLRDEGIAVSNGSLPPEVIKRIVRQNFGRFRLCYESGLRINPGLTGSVRTRFVIEADGAVGTVSDAGSSLPDAGVVTCVQHGFGQLAFPTLTGPSMTVTYSLSFAPAEP